MNSKKIAIVTTSINTPTKATKKFSEMGIPFIVAGDLKTPGKLYEELPNVIYLSPEYQEKNYKELSDSIGWNCIQRRNLAFVEAYKLGFDIIATVDDDNVPYDNWGKNIHIGKQVEADCYKSDHVCFDPLSITNHSKLWHRGFPIELVPYRKSEYLGKKTITPMVQSNLWDGDPDIDAICRLTYKPVCKFENITPYCGTSLVPFNSQNTFIHRDVLPYYMMLPFTKRMDDIWAAYILQHEMKIDVVFDVPTVYQERNAQSLITNLVNEIDGYNKTLSLVQDLANYEKYLDPRAVNSYQIYKKTMKSLA
jgi:hypothetical protein